ncbi:MAG: hypothetical protein Q9220_003647 [cf. Caloplaca sp. 1 TL-2023]
MGANYLQMRVAPRRSARLRRLAEQEGLKREGETAHQQLPSPSTTAPHEHPPARKRKLSVSSELVPTAQVPAKRLREVKSSREGTAADHSLGSIAHWASTGHWSATPSSQVYTKPAALQKHPLPGDTQGYTHKSAQPLEEKALMMNEDTSSKASSIKRKSSSVHRAERVQKLCRFGIITDLSDELPKAGKYKCEELLSGDRVPRHFPGYSSDQVHTVLLRAQNLNEARLNRDVTPWVAPSAEHSYLNGEITHDYLVDDIQATWIRSETMGSTRPKPDLTVGLSPNNFDKEETKKLESYSSPQRPSFVTPDLCFPFFMVEAKTGEEGLSKADRQNVHSAGIAVAAIVELHKAAYEATAPKRVAELFQKPLVFSVSHNNRLAILYAHFAVPSDTVQSGYAIKRCEIDMISFFKRDGVDRYKPYNFTLNVYQTIGQEHQKMIKEALAALPTVNVSVSSGYTLRTISLQDTSTQDEVSINSLDDEEAAESAETLQSVQAKRNLISQQLRQLDEQLRQLNEDGHEQMGK